MVINDAEGVEALDPQKVISEVSLSVRSCLTGYQFGTDDHLCVQYRVDSV